MSEEEIERKKEIKEAICELYESIKHDGFTPRATELVEKFRNELVETDMEKERSN